MGASLLKEETTPKDALEQENAALLYTNLTGEVL